MSNLRARIQQFIRQTLLRSRLKQGYSPQHASVSLGIDLDLLINYENGKSSPSCAELMRILKFYHVDVEELMFDIVLIQKQCLDEEISLENPSLD